MRLFPIVHLCSVLLILYSVSMFPILINVGYEDGDFNGFFMTFVLAFSVGITGWQLTRKGNTKLSSRDGFLVVVLFWLVFPSSAHCHLCWIIRSGQCNRRIFLKVFPALPPPAAHHAARR